MTKEELKRYNKGNDLSDKIRHIERELAIVNAGTFDFKIEIKERLRRQNMHRTSIDYIGYKDIVNKGIEAMLESILCNLNKEFKKL